MGDTVMNSSVDLATVQGVTGVTGAVRTIASGDVRDQVLTRDGASLLVSTTDGVVTRYDLASGSETGAWKVGNSLGGMATSADGRYLYATELLPVTTVETSSSFYRQGNVAELDRLDLQTGEVTRFDLTIGDYSSSTVFRDVAVTATGQLLLSTSLTGGYSGSSAIYLFDPQTGNLSRQNSSYYFGALAGTPDGQSIVIAELGLSSANLSLFTAGRGVTANREIYADNTSGQNTGGAIAISTDGSWVAQSVSRGGPDVIVLNRALKLEVSLAQIAPQALVGDGITGLAFSNDGARLYVLNSDADQVFMISTRDWLIESVVTVGAIDLALPNFNRALGYSKSLYADQLLVSADGRYLTVQGDDGVQAIDLTQTTGTPVLTALTLPDRLVIGVDGGNLSITAGAIDTGAAVQSVVLTLDSVLETTSGNVTEIRFDAARDAFDDTFSATNLALTGAAGGIYTVTSATVTDTAGHSVTYGAAALDALLGDRSFEVVGQIDLTTRGDTYTNTRDITVTVRGLAGDDTLYAGPGTVTLDGGQGDDDLFQGSGATTFIGGAGDDVAVLNGNARDYYVIGGRYVAYPSGYEPLTLLARNGSGTQVIGGDIERVRFADGTFLSASGDLLLGDQSQPGSVIGDYTLNAPASGTVIFNGGAGDNRVILPGDVSDYELGRLQRVTYGAAQAGSFALTHHDGSASYSFDQSVDTIQFADGRYLALRDLPAYVAGSAALDQGGNQDDLLYQSKPAGYEVFDGARGQDDLYLNGNVSDYTVRTIIGQSDPDAIRIDGIELVSTNGSGALLIDDSVEAVHFQNGQYLSFRDVAAYVAAAPKTDAVLHVIREGIATDNLTVGVAGTAAADDTLLLDRNALDYTLSRGFDGEFVLARDGGRISVSQTIDAIQFGNGQFLSLEDVPAYVRGNATFTRGTSLDDVLVVSRSGSQYMNGGAGDDDLFLNGNVRDYTLQTTRVQSPNYDQMIDGYGLFATNGSGNIYIDRSVETVHFQNGQTLAFEDLPAFFG
ncbi:hypothetical protein [Sphingomonas prati]|uniref:Calcium-binding protein n=1 Tax=Sphingomonas prati TaxID=1843237 RepID=A0A7W9F0E4_9SPHN|nr:hypothetical protein [Sphingomonas prati]MBB5728148.1 hypothetical protein [Sphingomonas prati]